MSDIDNLDNIIQFVEKPDSEVYSLKIRVGPYKDIIYSYGKCNIHEDEENDRLKVDFDWRLENCPKHLNKKEIEESKEFQDYIGNILTALIEEKAKNDEPTNTDIKNAD